MNYQRGGRGGRGGKQGEAPKEDHTAKWDALVPKQEEDQLIKEREPIASKQKDSWEQKYQPKRQNGRFEEQKQQEPSRKEVSKDFERAHKNIHDQREDQHRGGAGQNQRQSHYQSDYNQSEIQQIERVKDIVNELIPIVQMQDSQYENIKSMFDYLMKRQHLIETSSHQHLKQAGELLNKLEGDCINAKKDVLQKIENVQQIQDDLEKQILFKPDRPMESLFQQKISQLIHQIHEDQSLDLFTKLSLEEQKQGGVPHELPQLTQLRSSSKKEEFDSVATGQVLSSLNEEESNAKLVGAVHLASPFLGVFEQSDGSKQLIGIQNCKDSERNLDKEIVFFQEDTLKVVRTLQVQLEKDEIGDAKKKVKVRWVKMVGNCYTLIQLESSDYRITCYYNFIKANEKQIPFKIKFPIFEPTVVWENSLYNYQDPNQCFKYYMVFGSPTTGDLRYYSIQEGVAKNLQPRSNSYHIASRDLPKERHTDVDPRFQERKLTCLKWLPKSHYFASGLIDRNQGDLVITRPDEKNFKFSYREYIFLQRGGDGSRHMRVEDVSEIDDNVIVAMTSRPTEFFLVNIETRNSADKDQKSKVTHMKGGGFGSMSFTVNLFPFYDTIKQPYCIVREDSHIWIFDPPKNTLSHQLVEIKFKTNPIYLEQHFEIPELSSSLPVIFNSLQPKKQFYTVIPIEETKQYALATFQINEKTQAKILVKR
ncbi:hypothetical protein FGO68_gene16117 [Halteria grandinella]|uniref:Uncharacterized protein n=1 Tax=Halteria grandinella TaxID=5974 RepID=A0A8J8T5M4_HALGN|nr:hypothetical protein FGO68_gene16117 [Halteria grandinella]